MLPVKTAIHLTSWALLITLILLVRTASAQTAGQSVIQKKNVSAGFTNEAFTLSNGQLIGRTSAGTLSGLTLGSGLTLSGTTLSSTASGGTWGSITGTLSSQTDLNTALGLKAPLASPTFTGTVTAPNFVLSASEVDTLTGIQYGIGWSDDRFTLQGPPGALQMFTTGSPEESVLYWAGRIQVGSLEAAEITGEISGALVTSGVIPASVMNASMPQPLRAFGDGATYAGAFGLTYGTTGPSGATEPTTPGTYFPEILVVDGDPNTNYLEGRIRTAAQLRTDLGLGSLALVTPTGTADGSKFLRDDGSWQTVGGTFTGGTLTSRLIQSTNGASSASPLVLTGTIFTGGTATTTKPQLLVEPTGATSTAWNTAGTLYGGNAASGFTGSLMDLQVNGLSMFRVSSGGQVTFALGGSGGGGISSGARTGSLDLNYNGGRRALFGTPVSSSTGLHFYDEEVIGWTTTGNLAGGAADTLIISRAASNILGISGASAGASIEVTEMTAPAAPAANKARIYIEDNGSGKTRLMIQFPSGAAQQIAIEP